MTFDGAKLKGQCLNRAAHIIPKKSLGQNFLIDSKTIERILTSFCTLYEKGAVIEIGPGLGALTYPLLEKFEENLYLIEYDGGLLNHFKQNPRFPLLSRLIQADALSYPLTKLFANKEPYNIISNLPYNIATALIIKLLKTTQPCEHLVLMVQKEVAQQICATSKKTQHRGRLTLFCEYFCEQRNYLFEVRPTSFSPQPKVDSAVIHLQPFAQTPSLERWQALEALIAEGFKYRRKTLANALKGFSFSPATFSALAINPAQRAETLELSQWSDLLDQWKGALKAATLKKESSGL